MEIFRQINKDAAAADAGEHLNNFLAENKKRPILLMLSGGSALGITRQAQFGVKGGRMVGSEAVGEAAHQRLLVALGDQLVLGSPALLLRRLRGQQVAEAGRAAHELAAAGQLEALGDGFLGLLHREKG